MDILSSVAEMLTYRRFKKLAGEHYEREFSRPIKWENPNLFTEYINIFKISKEAEKFWIYTDKYKVREYVKKIIGNQYLNELYGVYNSPEEINLNSIPSSFVLKATHGSTWNIVVKDKKDLNWKETKEKLTHWLNTNYAEIYQERQYTKIHPRIICEKYMDMDSSTMLECKFYCFFGKVKILHCIKDRFTNVKKGFYSPDWQKVQLTVESHDNPLPLNISKPKNYDLMITLVEKLAAPFRHVRVDVYNHDGKITFGELTYTSNSGFIHYIPEKYDHIFGDWYRGAE